MEERESHLQGGVLCSKRTGEHEKIGCLIGAGLSTGVRWLCTIGQVLGAGHLELSGIGSCLEGSSDTSLIQGIAWVGTSQVAAPAD